ncbi:flippase [Polynucleobacter paneuropaeus]|nr:flippase [Polynucleobacter paneuropaeus]MBT8555576.1 flippase [Polynucleobacter paneuropaeus]MBT8560852.1 flippase [Polynucleobacter paneuropaeus]
MNEGLLKFFHQIIRLRVAGRPSLKAFLSNTSWLFADKVFRAIVGIFIGAWVARYLGPSNYGELMYVIAYIAIFQALSKLGMDVVVVREISEHPDRSNLILGSCLKSRVVAATISFLIALLIMCVLRPGDLVILGITTVIASSMIFQSSETVDLWFQSQSQSKKTVLAKGISYVGANSLKIFLIMSSAPLLYFSAAWLMEAILAAIALYIAYKRHPSAKIWRSQSSEVRSMLKESWPYLVSSLAVVIYMRVDQIMLRAIIDDFEVGIFSASATISEACYFIPMIIFTSAAPLLSKMRAITHEKYLRSFRKILSITWVLATVFSMIISYYASSIIQIIYGSGYAFSGKVLSIHAFAIVPVFIGTISHIWIVNEKKGYLAIQQTVAGVVSNILLNTFLIPKYGALGAAISTVISFYISAIIINAFLNRKLFKLQISALIFWGKDAHI